tara:strand:+ start:1245 stop:1874 length:630 start_codon:yes stop_codon:yes gene_type:complete
MKTLLYILIGILPIGALQAQVGIGVANPQADLHVGGDLLVQDAFKLGALNTVSATDEDFKLITRSTSSVPVGEITQLDVSSLNVAPVNIVNYHFTNLSSDNLSDLNLQYDTSKYLIGIANFRYVGDPIKKVSVGSYESIGQFAVSVFELAGTWHLEIQNRSLDLPLGDSVEYYITLVVYDRSYYRFLPPITTNLGGSTTGSASTIPVLN